MLATAATCPDTLVIGIDASHDSMAEASRRAARSLRRGGCPNALFVVAAAESLPLALAGCADALTVHFPWGSLLRGLLNADPALLGGIVRVTRPDAVVTLLLSVTARDGIAGISHVDAHTIARLAPAYDAAGLSLVGARPATPVDLIESHSTWAKRLRADGSRPVLLARFVRADVDHPAGGCSMWTTNDTCSARLSFRVRSGVEHHD